MDDIYISWSESDHRVWTQTRELRRSSGPGKYVCVYLESRVVLARMNRRMG